MVICLPDEPRIENISAAFFEQAFPADLKVALLWLAASIVIICLPVLNESSIRAMLVLPGILFFPGYCLIAALFPKYSDIDFIERIALSFGLSIAIVPIIAFWLNFTPWGIRLNPILIALTVFILVMVLIAHYRRSLLAREERFRVPFFEIVGTLWNTMFPRGGNRIDRLFTVVTTFAILAAVLATVYTFAVPKEGEHFTEFFILGENRTANGYPEQIIAGLDYPMFIGVGNHEHRNVTYTIETWILRTEFDSVKNTSTILSMEPLDHLSLVLLHNETTILPYNFSLQKTGYNRVEFLLFNETTPGPYVTGNDRINASYRDLNLWITVRQGHE
jgi:uncharacterized membrane protein